MPRPRGTRGYRPSQGGPARIEKLGRPKKRHADQCQACYAASLPVSISKKVCPDCKALR